MAWYRTGYTLFASSFLRQVFQAFAENTLSIDMVATSEVSISLTLDKQQDRNSLLRYTLQYTLLHYTVIGTIYTTTTL